MRSQLSRLLHHTLSPDFGLGLAAGLYEFNVRARRVEKFDGIIDVCSSEKSGALDTRADLGERPREGSGWGMLQFLVAQIMVSWVLLDCAAICLCPF